jgi:hypothetical protein
LFACFTFRQQLALVTALAAAFAAAPSGARADGILQACEKTTLAYADGPGDVPSPCTLPRGQAMLETLYYQNASKAGGTALAAYPLVRVRAGFTSRAEFIFDAPSQVAESGLGGAGLYPVSQLGFGVVYTLAQTRRAAFAVHAEALPPASRFIPSHTQSKYFLAITPAYALTPAFTITGLFGGATARTGSSRIFSTSAIGFAFTPDRGTRLTVDLGNRYIARRAAAQSFGDVAVARSLSRNTIVDLGLGTTFNCIQNTKAHYLAMGVTYRR